MASSIELRPREDLGMESITSILTVASHISYEDITLIWVDWNANETADCLHTHDCLRAVVNDVKIFSNAEQSIEYIQWIASEKNIFLIISGLLAEPVLSQTHNVPQLESVYIFCLNKKKHASLMNQYAKIRGIFVDKFKLFHQMAEDVLKFDKKAFPLHIFAQMHENGIETSIRDYVTDNKITLNWLELFCFILIYLPLDRKQAKQDMITQCRMYYHGNEVEQRRIDEFEQRNCTENIIHWYTRDSFVYRLINKALRTLNIDVIFQFRFFIIELYRQLKSYHTNYIESLLSTPTSATKTRTVYRGQFISAGELEKLKNNVGDIISANSFLSTTEDEMVAKAFIADAPISESALFEINISDSYYDQIGDSLSYTRPFFKVESLSKFGDENEIIFSMGTIFRIISIDEHSILRIRLELDEHNNSIAQHYWHVQEKHRYRHDWQTRSSVDERILLLTEKLPKSYRAIVGLYTQEGLFIDENQPLTIVTESISCYRRGFDLLCRCLPDHFYLLRVIMCLSIGLYYNNLGDTAMSINLGEPTLSIVKDYLFADSECLLVCYNYLAVIYKLDNRLDAAFSISRDMLCIASKHKNTSALVEIYDKLCGLSRTFTLHEYRRWCQKKMFKCLVRLLTRKIISLPDHNHPFYLNYKTLIKFLQRLIKYKWPCKRKRCLEVLLAKQWPPFRSFAKYIDKLKFMLYFELEDLSRFQSSLHSLLAQAMTEFESRQTYENCFQQLRHDLKCIFKIVPARLAKIDLNVKILQNFLRSINAYECSLYSMRTTYGLTERANRNENIALKSILNKIKIFIPDLIRSNRQKLRHSRQHRIFRPRHRSSPMYLNRNTN